MIIYIALNTWDDSPYMSATILGIFSTEILAKRCCRSHSQQYEDEEGISSNWIDARNDTMNYHNLISKSDNDLYGVSQFELDKLQDWKGN